MCNFAQEYAKLVYEHKPVTINFYNEQIQAYIALSVNEDGEVFEVFEEFGKNHESRQAIPVYWGKGIAALARAIETLTDWEKNKR
jgi:hypothetical protein